MSHEILPTDGPLACIWKALHGQGWLDVNEVIKAATRGNYSETAIRRKLYEAGFMVERKEEFRPGTRRKQVFYQLREGAALPTNEVVRTTKKERTGNRLSRLTPEDTQSMALPRWLM